MSISLFVLAMGLAAPAIAADPDKPHPHQGVAQKFTNPQKSTFTAEEEATLASGSPIYKQVRLESGGRGVAIFDVQASTDKVWQTIGSFERYPDWIDALKDCEVYKRDGSHIYARFKLGMSAMGAEYYIDHTLNKAQGHMTWTLDYSRESDLNDSTGYWLVYPSGRDGFTRVEYTVDVRVGSLPKFIEDMVAKKGIKDATTWLKRESEK